MSDLDKIMDDYRRCLREGFCTLSESTKLVINQEKINGFIKRIQGIDQVGRSQINGCFLTQLIAIGYYAYRINYFELDLKELLPQELCIDFRADPSRIIEFHVHGNLGMRSFKGLENANCFLNGNPGAEFASSSMNSKFYIKGDIKQWDVCTGIMNCKVSLDGKIETTDFGSVSAESVFEVYTRENYDRLASRKSGDEIIGETEYAENNIIVYRENKPDLFKP